MFDDLRPMIDFSVIQSCTLGDFYQSFSDAAWSWAAGEIFNRISYICLAILGVWAALWVAWQCFRGARGSSINMDELTNQIFIFIGVSSFLTGWVLFFQFVSLMLMSAFWIAGQIITITTSATIFDMGSLICTIGNSFNQSYEMSFGFFADVGITDGLSMAFLGFLFMIPWFLLWLRMIKTIAEPIMTVFNVLLFSAPTALLFAAPAFRRTVLVDLKILITACFQIIVYSALFALAVAFMNFAFDQLPTREIVENGQTIMVPDVDPGEWLGTDAYWMAFFVLIIILWNYEASMSYVRSKMEVTMQSANSTMGAIFSSI